MLFKHIALSVLSGGSTYDIISSSVVFAAAIVTSMLPIAYSRYPWRSSKLGRLFMAQCVSISMLCVMSLFLSLFTISHRAQIVVTILVFGSLVVTTTRLSTYIFGYPWSNHED